LISEGRAFMSKVFKICVTFANQADYSFVLKVSQHKQWKNYADDGNGESSPERDENDNCLRDKQKEMMEIGERYHNIECCFYNKFPPIPGCPTPKTFYVEAIDAYSDGLILMENLAGKFKPNNYYITHIFRQCRTYWFLPKQHRGTAICGCSVCRQFALLRRLR
jgi:hypothetical protein